ncbi:MAG: ABC transporter permease, partial [Blastocatellia bacterium]
MTLTGSGDAEQVRVQFVSSGIFQVLGITPVIGRDFAPGEDDIGAVPIAVISAGFWKSKFQSSPAVLGKTLALDGKSFTIVGVVPAIADPINNFRDSPVYLPIGQWTNPILNNRSAGLGFHGFGRLKPGVTIQQAQADMDVVTKHLSDAYPEDDNGIGASLFPLTHDTVGGVRPSLLLLLAAVGFVLLIACANVANLMLARSTSRAREFAIRAALGAGRIRLVRQLLTESVLLAVAGGGLGLLLAAWGTKEALRHLPAALPRSEHVGVDFRVMIFTGAVSLFAGILFGLAPAIKTAQSSLREALNESGRGLSGARHRTQEAFVTIEVALALVLLVGAGLMIRTMAGLWRVDPGFKPHNVLTFGLSLPPSMNNANPEAVRQAFREVDRQFAAIPGIQSVSVTWGAVPLAGDDETIFWPDGQPKPATDKDMSWALSYVVEPDYLKAMGIPLKHGRFFTDQDDSHSPHVVVVDEAFASKFFGTDDPIGKRINLAGGSSVGPAQIVGVVGHVKQWGMDSEENQLQAQMYFPFSQLPDQASSPGVGYIVRSDEGRAGVFDSIRETNRRMSDQQVVFNPQTMDELIAGSLARRQFSMILLAVFAELALVLATVGIYGVISYWVGQRTHEIGVRMALGAERSVVLRLVLSQGALLTVVGVALGLAS